MIQAIRAKMSKSSKKRSNRKNNKTQKKSNKKSHNRSSHRGGAIYSFDLNDKIGGLAANIPLNGTQDGDCPKSPTGALGFTNYGMTQNASGGGKKNKNKKSHKKSNKKHKKSKK
jgi:hypothetical protein